MTIIQNPRQFKVPDWMLNRKKDVKDGKFSQVVSNTLDMKLREDLERLKKIRAHRGLRHYCAPPPSRITADTPGRLQAKSCRWPALVCLLSPTLSLSCRGPARAWPADQDDRPQGPHRRCVQEEGLDLLLTLLLRQAIAERW